MSNLCKFPGGVVNIHVMSGALSQQEKLQRNANVFCKQKQRKYRYVKTNPTKGDSFSHISPISIILEIVKDGNMKWKRNHHFRENNQ